HPEGGWRVTPEEVTRLAGVQLAIVHRMADLVAVGGRLIYATCTFLKEEDDGVVARFLAERPEFVPMTAKEILGAERPAAIGDGETLRLWPHRHGTDAFYAAV